MKPKPPPMSQHCQYLSASTSRKSTGPPRPHSPLSIREPGTRDLEDRPRDEFNCRETARPRKRSATPQSQDHHSVTGWSFRDSLRCKYYQVWGCWSLSFQVIPISTKEWSKTNKNSVKFRIYLKLEKLKVKAIGKNHKLAPHFGKEEKHSGREYPRYLEKPAPGVIKASYHYFNPGTLSMHTQPRKSCVHIYSHACAPRPWPLCQSAQCLN